MIVRWGGEEEREVSSLDELEGLLDAIDREGTAILVELEHDTGSSLAVGVGYRESVLSFGDGQGNFYTSVGDKRRRDPGVEFQFGGQESEFYSAMLIPCTDARAAARTFFVGGGMPNNVTWDRDLA